MDYSTNYDMFSQNNVGIIITIVVVVVAAAVISPGG